jgi:hypothetical protein
MPVPPSQLRVRLHCKELVTPTLTLSRKRIQNQGIKCYMIAGLLANSIDVHELRLF